MAVRRGRVGLVALVVACLASAFSGCGDTGTPGGAGSSSPAVIRVVSLKGPTTMGLVGMMADPSYLAPYDASFAVEGTADAITGQLLSGTVDIALIPANLAAVLYARTDNIQVLGVNTLNVLYLVSRGVPVVSLDDLAGRTVYAMGRGTTPQAVLDTILNYHHLNGKVDVRYLSEATEVATRLATDDAALAVLPQPYVAIARSRDPQLAVVADLGAEFQQATGAPVVTGVTVVRRAFAEANPAAVAAFAAASARSAAYANDNPAAAGPLIAQQGITPNTPTAIAAIPMCGIVSLTGPDARAALDGYYTALYAVDPALIGGTVPGNGFYW